MGKFGPTIIVMVEHKPSSEFSIYNTDTIEYTFLRQITPIFIDDNGCWFRKRNPDKTKYSKIGHIQSHVYSARLFLGLKKDSILQSCHKCDIPACFNPFHLFLGTISDNKVDLIRKRNITSIEDKLRLTYDIIDDNSIKIVQLDEEIDWSLLTNN